MRRFAASIGSLVKDRRATADAVTAAPTPLQPIDLTDDARVAEVLDLAVRIGDLLLASGTSAIDTATQVKFVAATYGLAQCDVDVNYNSINISAHRGPLIPPASTMRIIHYRSMDFTRLAAADRLTRKIRLEAITPAEAHAALDAIVSAPHPYNRWLATLGWAGLAASVAVLLGGGVLITVVAFLTSVVIDRVNRVLNRVGLPYFFQQMMGGLIASAPATALYAVQDQLGIEIRPSQIIAAGVVVLLSGLSLVGSVQDAITGAPITASARFFEVVMMTGGIIAGVALSLRVATALGAELPVSSAAEQDITQLPVQVAAGAVASLSYALACYAERRALTVAALGGAAGMLFYVLAHSSGIGPVISSAIAATVIGFAGGLMARRALTPPLVVAVAGITPLLPGLSLYRGLYGMLNDEVLIGLTALLGAFGIGCALAAGVTLGEWGARTLRRPPRMRRNAAMRRNTTLRRPRFGRRSVVMNNSAAEAVVPKAP